VYIPVPKSENQGIRSRGENQRIRESENQGTKSRESGSESGQRIRSREQEESGVGYFPVIKNHFSIGIALYLTIKNGLTLLLKDK
jgi:hypothetical protein